MSNIDNKKTVKRTSIIGMLESFEFGDIELNKQYNISIKTELENETFASQNDYCYFFDNQEKTMLSFFNGKIIEFFYNSNNELDSYFKIQKENKEELIVDYDFFCNEIDGFKRQIYFYL